MSKKSSATSSTSHEYGTAWIMIGAVIDARSNERMQFVRSPFEIAKTGQVL